MRISTSSYSFTAFDGKIILRTVIDKPTESNTAVHNYLYDYSTKIDKFAREKLFESLLKRYEESDNTRNRFSSYNFSFKIINTYANENLNSYLMISRLYQGYTHLISNADSIIVQYDKILPAKLITKIRKKGSVLILNDDGYPFWVDVTMGDIAMTPAEKCISLN